MARFSTALAAGLLLAGTAIVASAPASAQARFCPTRESFFGTVQSVQGRTLMVQTRSGGTGQIVLDDGARVNAHGFSMRPGTFVGAFGCVTPNGVFHASEVTLAGDAALFSTTISGTVQRKSGNVLYVFEPARRTTGLWFVPDIDDFHVGQAVTGIGMMGANGEFYPQQINNASTAFTPEGVAPSRRTSITLSGVVRRVGSGTISVWEPSRGTTGTWFVRNSLRFRVGQRVIGTGTENRRGDFYPFSVQVQ